MDFKDLHHLPASPMDETLVQLMPMLVHVHPSTTLWRSAGAYDMADFPPSHHAVEVTDGIPVPEAVTDFPPSHHAVEVTDGIPVQEAVAIANYESLALQLAEPLGQTHFLRPPPQHPT